ncbi:MAG: hypothetical protein CMJ75_17685 [Planctomycetaceae bacterium]|nr:hypothetical protein [Planctomycetaceae bacterium]
MSGDVQPADPHFRELGGGLLAMNEQRRWLREDDELLEMTAYHEAGHALMAFHVGARVRSMSLSPDADGRKERYAEVAVEWPRERFATREYQVKAIQVALAGPAAEMHHRGEPFHPGFVSEWAADWQAAWEATECLAHEPAQRIRLLEHWTSYVYQWLDRTEHWAALAAIVDHLLAHEHVEGSEIDDLVGPWLG